jgi:hypothetical protein
MNIYTSISYIQIYTHLPRSYIFIHTYTYIYIHTQGWSSRLASLVAAATLASAPVSLARLPDTTTPGIAFPGMSFRVPGTWKMHPESHFVLSGMFFRVPGNFIRVAVVCAGMVQPGTRMDCCVIVPSLAYIHTLASRVSSYLH